MSDCWPTIILGGSDRRPGVLPERGKDKHPLAGYKGALIRVGGRPLVSVITERLQASGSFGPIYIAGPREVYGDLKTGAEVIDTNGSFGENIEAAIETVRALNPGLPIAFHTCDVLLSVDELRELADLYRSCDNGDFFFPLVRVPDSPAGMEESAWKPKYRIPLVEGGEPVSILPGHLVIVNPTALRLPFIYRLFQIGYATRNRSIGERRNKMVIGVAAQLLWQDFLHLMSGRLPLLTYNVIGTGVPAAQKLRRGTASLAYIERCLRRIFIKALYRAKHPETTARLPVVDILALAADLDTEEEVREWGGELSSHSG